MMPDYPSNRPFRVSRFLSPVPYINIRLSGDSGDRQKTVTLTRGALIPAFTEKPILGDSGD